MEQDQQRCRCDCLLCETERRHWRWRCENPTTTIAELYGLQIPLCRWCLDALRREHPGEIIFAGHLDDAIRNKQWRR